METIIKGRKLIGKGAFSKVYDDGEHVIIATVDPAKEVFADLTRYSVHNRYLPVTVRLDNNESERYFYSQQKFDPVKSVKDFEEIKILQNLQKDFVDRLNKHDNEIRKNPDTYRKYRVVIFLEALEDHKDLMNEDLYDALHDTASHFGNFSHNLGFEVAKRNLKRNGDQLILLDCFFCHDLLRKVRPPRFI